MLKSIRNSIVVTSALYIIMGTILIVCPGTALNIACTIIGVITLLYGAIRVAGYFRGDGSYYSRFDLFWGILLCALGAFLLICPQVVVSIIPIALGVFIIVDSFTSAKKALDMKALGFDKWWLSLIISAILAVFGVIMIVSPFGAAESLVVFIGVSFVLDGVFTLLNTIAANKVFRS